MDIYIVLDEDVEQILIEARRWSQQQAANTSLDDATRAALGDFGLLRRESWFDILKGVIWDEICYRTGMVDFPKPRRTFRIKLTQNNISRFIGMLVKDEEGLEILLTNEIAPVWVGRIVSMRDPDEVETIEEMILGDFLEAQVIDQAYARIDEMSSWLKSGSIWKMSSNPARLKITLTYVGHKSMLKPAVVASGGSWEGFMNQFRRE